MPTQKVQIVQDMEAQWICPITQMTIKDPVITCDGHTYEKCVIQQWLKRSNKSPVTGLELQADLLFPNHILKSIIDKFNLFKNDIKNVKFDGIYAQMLLDNKQHIDNIQKQNAEIRQQLQIILCEKQKLEDNVKRLELKNLKMMGYEKSHIRVRQTNPKSQSMNSSASKLSSDIKYMYDVFLSKQQVQKRYTIDQYLGLYSLGNFWVIRDHHPVDINMNKFLNHNWINLQMLNLIGCGINDQSWSSFLLAYRGFAHLKLLYLAYNQICTVREYSLQKFKELKYINFGQSAQSSNPLFIESKQVLAQYKIRNPFITVLYLEDSQYY